jgi:hypothetical protein
MNALYLVILIAACAKPAPSHSPDPSPAPTTATPASDLVAVNVTVTGRPADIIKELEQHGLRVDKQLDEIGVITGHASKDSLAALRAVPGVTAIELDQSVQIAPAAK